MLIDNVLLNAPNTLAFASKFSCDIKKSEQQQQLLLPPLQPPSLVLVFVRSKLVASVKRALFGRLTTNI